MAQFTILNFILFGHLILEQGMSGCPEPAEVAPCTCTISGKPETSTITTSCGQAENEDVIESIFHSTSFPEETLEGFFFSNNDNFRGFTRNLFGNKTFRFVSITSNGGLEYVDSTAFGRSYNTLRSWYVSTNKKLSIEGFPFASLEQYSALQNLEISGCPLDELPIISSLSLARLTLNADNISHIPANAFGALPNLKSLTLAQNPIKSINSGTFILLPNIETIKLSHNKIQKVSSEAFADLKQLQEIRLNGNLITNIDPAMIVRCPELSLVMLHSNSLTRLEVSTPPFVGVEFNLDKNSISTIQEGAFAGLRNGTLRLAFNSIRTLDEIWLGPLLKKNNFVELSRNPLDCGCDLRWLFRRNYSLSPFDLLTGTCADGTDLSRLKPEYFRAHC